MGRVAIASGNMAWGLARQRGRWRAVDGRQRSGDQLTCPGDENATIILDMGWRFML
jgi:hypothetical protein